ncbi:MAG: YegP family protein, partial [Bacteroidota bacterium]
MKIKTTRKPSTGQFFFNFVTNDDKVVLKSEAYESRAACDNGKQSVLKNAGNDDRYDRLLSSDNRFYFNLKAANGQVIGTSVMFETEEEREEAIKLLQGLSRRKSAKAAEGTAKQTATSTTTTTSSSDSASGGKKETDDYRHLGFYVSYGAGGEAGYYSFQGSDDEEHYFTLNDPNGYVLLYSQGYTNESGRDNGIESVKKNSKIEDRYNRHQTDSGRHYFTLKAGNNQE